MSTPTRVGRALLTGLLLLSAVGSLDCRRTAGPDSLFRLVPATSIVVLRAKWQEVRRDDHLRRLIKGSGIEQAMQSAGINGEAVDDLIVFGDGADSTRGNSGMILSCPARAQALVDHLRSQGWDEQVYRARKVYHSSTGDRWIAPVKQGTLVLGTRQGVEATLDAEQDARASLAASELGRQLLKEVSKKRGPISFLLLVPQSLHDMSEVALQVFSAALDFAGAGPLGGLLNKIGFAKGVGCSISKSGNAFPVDLLMVMKDEGAASFVSGTLNLLKQASSRVSKANMPEVDREKVKSLQSLVVTRDHDLLSIKMTMLEDDLLPN